MKIAVFAYSRQGCRTARRIMRCFEREELRAYTMERFQEPDFAPVPSSPDFYGTIFENTDAMIFVGACGIALRKIAPYIRSKQTDPAVVVVDELGKFVIPILSGHIGGANALSQMLAEKLGAIPVITTATDIHHKFSVDAWAVENGCKLSSLGMAKAVSAAILEGDVPLCSDFPIVTGLPSGVVPGDSGEIGIRITCEKDGPFGKTLRLIPPVLHLGIGCRKGVEAEVIREAVDQVLSSHNLDRRAVKCVASIDLKAEEPGLLQFCQEEKLPVSFYSGEKLQAVPGEFTPSEFVRGVTGVDNVCERAALMGAEKLIVRKTPRGGVTVAVAMEHWEVHFG